MCAFIFDWKKKIKHVHGHVVTFHTDTLWIWFWRHTCQTGSAWTHTEVSWLYIMADMLGHVQKIPWLCLYVCLYVRTNRGHAAWSNEFQWIGTPRMHAPPKTTHTDYANHHTNLELVWASVMFYSEQYKSQKKMLIKKFWISYIVQRWHGLIFFLL